jgi:phosphate transport system permease protein
VARALSVRRRAWWADGAFRALTRLVALLLATALVAILLSLLRDSLPALRTFGWRFLAGREWNPVIERFGALPAIYGTLVTSAIAMVLGVPLSFGIALFITELAPPWLRQPLGVAIELLAAIPSIIYGMWGLSVLSPLLASDVEPWLSERLGGWPMIGALFSGPPLGIGLLPAGIILAVMVVPFVASVMRDVFETVPSVLHESACALGTTTWETVWRIVLPYTRQGVMGAILLGLGRALGETMAVTFVICNANEIHASLLMPGNTIAAALANEFNEAVGTTYTSSLIALGLVLFLITLVVLALSRLMLQHLARAEGKP